MVGSQISIAFLRDELLVKIGETVTHRASFASVVERVEINHAAWIEAQLESITVRLASKLDHGLGRALTDELIVQELNGFDFDRLASWEMGRLAASTVGNSAAIPRSLTKPPGGFDHRAFAAGWRVGGGLHQKSNLDPISPLVASFAALGIVLASVWGKWRLRATSQLPAHARAVFITPTAMTNQGRHAFEMASREDNSVVVLLGHGLFGRRRANAVRRACGDAKLVWPVSLRSLLDTLPKFLNLTRAAQNAAVSFSATFGRPYSFSHRIELSVRLLRGLVFAAWAREQKWPKTVAFSIASRLDRQIADDALRHEGLATAHMIHGLHGAGNPWGYRAANTLAITFLEAERPLRRRYGRYGSDTSLQKLRPKPYFAEAELPAEGSLLVCTNMLHQSNPWFCRDPIGIHLRLFDAASRWAEVWGCEDLLWRPHPAGRVHAPRQFAELCAIAANRGWSLADGPMPEVLARSKAMVTPPSGVFIDALREGRVPLLISGIVNEVLEPWTHLPPEIWVDIGLDAAEVADRHVATANLLPFLQEKFLHPAWSEIHFSDIDQAAWAAEPSKLATPIPSQEPT